MWFNRNFHLDGCTSKIRWNDDGLIKQNFQVFLYVKNENYVKERRMDMGDISIQVCTY